MRVMWEGPIIERGTTVLVSSIGPEYQMMSPDEITEDVSVYRDYIENMAGDGATVYPSVALLYFSVERMLLENPRKIIVPESRSMQEAIEILKDDFMPEESLLVLLIRYEVC